MAGPLLVIFNTILISFAVSLSLFLGIGESYLEFSAIHYYMFSIIFSIELLIAYKQKRPLAGMTFSQAFFRTVLGISIMMLCSILFFIKGMLLATGIL